MVRCLLSTPLSCWQHVSCCSAAICHGCNTVMLHRAPMFGLEHRCSGTPGTTLLCNTLCCGSLQHTTLSDSGVARADSSTLSLSQVVAGCQGYAGLACAVTLQTLVVRHITCGHHMAVQLPPCTHTQQQGTFLLLDERAPQSNSSRSHHGGLPDS